MYYLVFLIALYPLLFTNDDKHHVIVPHVCRPTYCAHPQPERTQLLPPPKKTPPHPQPLPPGAIAQF